MNTWFIITYLIAIIGYLVLMIISSNKDRREIFPWFIAIPVAPIVVTINNEYIKLIISIPKK